MKKTRKKYKKEDLRIIMDNSIPADVAGFMVNLAASVITQMRFKGKFAESLKKASQRYRDKLKQRNDEKFGGAHGCYKYWKAEEIKYIMTSDDTDEMMAEKLNRTVYAIQKKREREAKKRG